MKKCKILLFEGFETLDVFGPIEVLSCLDDVEIELWSLKGGLISSSQGYKVETFEIQKTEIDILLLPGGQGTRELVNDVTFLETLEEILYQSEAVLSVCTGTALLAKTSYLNGLKATTNKRAFNWVTSLNSKIHWQRRSRWVASGSIYTSSGVSAGIDMTLGFISDHYSLPVAEDIARRIEYNWCKDAENDPFAVE